MTASAGDGVQLLFEDTTRAIDLVYDSDFLDLIRKIVPHWPFQILEEQEQFVEPFASLEETRSRQIVSSTFSEHRKRFRSPIDTICELVAQLAWATIEANPEWLCVHCAACEINGGLVLFPAIRKSGKSTMTAVLGSQGIPIFTDDFLGIEIDATGNLLGISGGVATRMRLPWPDNLSQETKAGLQDCMVASNESYSYHHNPGAMPIVRGRRSPIRAIVLLDREEDLGTAELQEASFNDVLTTIVEQNFARVKYADHILTALHFLAAHVPRYRLKYASVEDGANIVKHHFQSTECVAAPPLPDNLVQHEPITGSSPSAPSAAIDPDQPLKQSGAVKYIEVEENIYLAETTGYGVHKLDQISGAIWRLLSEPISIREIVSLLSEAFPETSEQQISSDVRGLMDRFNNAGLITNHDKSS